MKKLFTLFSFVLAFGMVINAQSTYTLNTTTYTSSTTNGSLITYQFSNSCSVSNNSTKGYGTGSSSGIKYSAGVQYTITFPTTISILSVSFYGYDNYAGKRSYFSEMNGTLSTDTTVNYLAAKNGSTAVMSTVTYDYSASPVTTGTFTFTPAGNQIVATITVTYSSTTTGVQTVTIDPNKPTSVYTLDGKRIKTNVFRGLATDGLKSGLYIIDNKKVIVNKKQ
jgi:hypothetical protein